MFHNFDGCFVAVFPEKLMESLRQVIDEVRYAWGLMMSEHRRLWHNQHLLKSTHHLQDFFLQTLNVVCSVILEVS